VVKLQISSNKLQTIYNAQKQKPFPDKHQNLEIIKQMFDHRTIPIKPSSAWSFGISFWDLFVFWSLFIVIFPET
jgi:hypothetical protein